jgi:CRP-like cAMP-binding protein/Fe-S-cluster-containing hydrogenase component 2
MEATLDAKRHAAAHGRAADAARQLEELHWRQAMALAQLDCLKGVSPECLRRLAGVSTMRAFIPGALLIDEQSPGQWLYLILRGTVYLHLHDRLGREVPIGFLNRGDCFGEGPLFGDQFRSVAAQAETTCYLLQIALADLRPLVSELPELASALRAVYRDRLVASTLGRVPLFSQLTPLERAGISETLLQRRYPRGAVILQRGATGDALYLIESGQVVVEDDGRAIAHLDEGDFFGEMSLLTDQPHNANVRTLTPTEVLMLPAAAFQLLLRDQPDLAEQMREVVARRRETNTSMRQDVERTRQLEAALTRGLLRGRHVLVRDPQLCQAGCQQCVDACTTRHGHARIATDGVILNGVDVTSSCRQCRVGAECIEACPHDALQWSKGGALVVTDACTGCGACVPACPYDAVKLVSTAPVHTSPLWALWERMKSLRNPTIPLEAAHSHRADKCDLCHGFGDLACVTACPTGALRLAPVEEVFPL